MRRFDHDQAGALFGHATVRQQLGWCGAEDVPRMIVTHCGSGIVGGDERRVARRVREMAAEHGLEAVIAHDGMTLVLR
jgi:hypothetical protein